MQQKCLSIILASFNDPRIVDAIASIRRFDDVAAVRLVIIDGGSSEYVQDLIRQNLAAGDIFLCEKDRGIFDGLNKGLDRCDTEYVGWLGSDDRFTSRVLASEVIAALERHELFIANVAFFREGRVLRITHSLPSRLGLVKYGLHNPHYATFGRAELLKSERFDLGLMGSDVDYFHRIFDKKPSVATTSAIATLQFAGGYSNSSYWKILRINWQLLASYARHNNILIAPLLLLVKLGYKALATSYFRLFPMDVGKVEKRIRAPRD